MSTAPLSPPPDRRVQALLDGFSVDPSDTRKFRAVEEELFVAGQWSQLAGVYECRLSALASDESAPSSTERGELLLRLADLLAARLAAPDAARGHYETLLQREPRNGAALSGLRRLHTNSGDLTSALQVAEIEESLDLAPADLARTSAETGELWRRLGDAGEAGRRFERALQADAGCDGARAGLAQLAEDAGDFARAAELHEQRLDTVRGPARIDLLEHLASILPDEARDRARSLLREVVRERPDRRSAVERLLELERGTQSWERVDVLTDSLWELVPGAERAQLALRAATEQLDEAGNPDLALRWLERAAALIPDEVAVHRLRARIHRRSGHIAGLIDALVELDRIEGASAMRSLEIAVLYERDDRPEEAIATLQALLEREPDDEEALEIIDRCLARAGRWADRIDILKQRIARTDDAGEKAGLHVQIGDVQRGELDAPREAERAYRDALACTPDHLQAVDRMLELLHEGERFGDLAQFLSEAAERAAPGAPRASYYCELGRLCLDSLGDPSGARKAFGRALDCDPQSETALSGLREVSAASGDVSALLEACERELALDPPRTRRCELFFDVFNAAREAGDLPRARAAAENWTAIEVTTPAFQALVDITAVLGDAAGEASALERLETLLQAEPVQRSRCLERLGDLALEQADPESLDTAAHWYREGLEVQARSELRAKLTDLYRRTGRTTELVVQLRAELDPAGDAGDVRGVRLELSRALAELGDIRGAVEAVTPAFDHDSADGEVGDVLEGLLADQDRIDELCNVLGRRLEHEREPSRRRELANRRAGLQLDALSRPIDAIATLRELADPSRNSGLEQIYERALEVGGDAARIERIGWLAKRETQVDGEPRLDLLLRLATLQQEEGEIEEAIGALHRAERLVPPDQLDLVRQPLLSLLRTQGNPEAQLDLLAKLLEDGGDATTTAAFRIERARILIDELEAPDRGRVELDALDGVILRESEQRLIVALAGRAGAAERQRRAIEMLLEISTDEAECKRLRLTLVDLLAHGPADGRDDPAAIEILRTLLETDPQDEGLYDRLGVLLEHQGDRQGTVELLRARLALPSTGPEARDALALRLAHLLVDLGELDDAIALLESARATSTTETDPALVELLFRTLELGGHFDRRLALCEQQAHDSAGPERARWLRRWLAALESRGEAAEERLAVIDCLLEEEAGHPELMAMRLPLLRSLGRIGTLAEGLEQALAGSGGPSGERRVRVRELLQIYESALDDPARALALVRREVANDPALRTRGARLAARLGQTDVEIELLELEVSDALAQGRGTEVPAQLRRLALAFASLDRERDAEPLLWRSLDTHPRDRAVLAALEEILRPREDRSGLLRLLETHYDLEAAEGRLSIAKESARLANEDGDRSVELRWTRRWNALEPVDSATLERWLKLEREVGNLPGQLQVLGALRELTEDPAVCARLLAEEAGVRARSGQLELARALYDKALDTGGDAPADWLQELDHVLEAQGRTAERTAVLKLLSTHAALSPAERARHQETHVGLLAALPQFREEAAAQLRGLVDNDLGADRALRLARMRLLLGLYDDLERAHDWRALAEDLLPMLEGNDARELERELARRLAALPAREAAIRLWETLLERDASDCEALASLAELLDTPGCESRRADVLERYASAGGLEPGSVWLEAARLRWNVLRDATAAARNLKSALLAAPLDVDAHSLRREIAACTGDASGEAESLVALLESRPNDVETPERWLRLAELRVAAFGTTGAPGKGARDAAIHAARQALASAEAAGRIGAVRPAACMVLEHASDWDRAANLITEELACVPAERRAGLLRRLARIEWEELDRGEAASRTLEELERESELETEDHARWADVLESLGRWRDAHSQRSAALRGSGELAADSDWLELAHSIIAHGEAAESALPACDAALARAPDSIPALTLRADLRRQLDQGPDELEDRVRLGELSADRIDSAAAFSRAAEIARHTLRDDTRASTLYRQALKRDASYTAALLGAGEIALGQEDWNEAERMLGMACTLLSGRPHTPAAQNEEDPGSHADKTGDRADVARAARKAAEAALKLARNGEALRYLELSLEYGPDDPAALDGMAELSLRLGAHDRARQCIEDRMRLAPAEPRERAEQLLRLAQACEGCDDRVSAASALEEVVGLRPNDEVARARLVDLLEALGETDRATEQLDAWVAIAPSAEAPAITLRAARMEVQCGRAAEARARLETLLEVSPALGDAWVELASLALDEEGSAGALGVTERGLGHVEDPTHRGSLLWIQARALYELGQIPEAAQRSCEALETDLANVDAARMLAEHLGQVSDFRHAVTQLERSLDVSHPGEAVEAELWEAIGRAYAGPLEDIERAQLAYRRALEANPLRATAREALADTTAFDPGSHRESVDLHRDLLDNFPSRPGSWRAISRMAEHWGRDRVMETASCVLEALGLEPAPESAARPLVRTSGTRHPAVRAACELLNALADAQVLPEPNTAGAPAGEALDEEISERVGWGWALGDAQLTALWSGPIDEETLGANLAFRARRKLKKSLRALERASLRDLDVELWREELLAEAAARAVASGRLTLRDALIALLESWPATTSFDVRTGGDLGAIVQLCPPARALLLRVADESLSALGF